MFEEHLFCSFKWPVSWNNCSLLSEELLQVSLLMRCLGIIFPLVIPVVFTWCCLWWQCSACYTNDTPSLHHCITAWLHHPPVIHCTSAFQLHTALNCTTACAMEEGLVHHTCNSERQFASLHDYALQHGDAIARSKR